MADKTASRLTMLTHYALLLRALAAGPPYPIDIAASTERFGFAFIRAHIGVLQIPADWAGSVEVLTREDPFSTDLLVEAVLTRHLDVLEEFIASIEPTRFAEMAGVRGVNQTVWQTGWQDGLFIAEVPVRQILHTLHKKIVCAE